MIHVSCEKSQIQHQLRVYNATTATMTFVIMRTDTKAASVGLNGANENRNHQRSITKGNLAEHLKCLILYMCCLLLQAFRGADEQWVCVMCIHNFRWESSDISQQVGVRKEVVGGCRGAVSPGIPTCPKTLLLFCVGECFPLSASYSCTSLYIHHFPPPPQHTL